MTAKLNWLFALALLGFFAWTLLEAQAFRAQARLFPVVIGVTGLLLTAVYLAGELWRARRPAGVDQPPGAADDAVTLGEEYAPEFIPAPVRRRRTAAILGWVVGFAVAIWLLGFAIAVPLATFAYLRFGSGESWRVSLIFTAAAGILFYGLFVEIVRIPFEPGLLPSLLPD